jgi:hypothetical protein
MNWIWLWEIVISNCSVFNPIFRRKKKLERKREFLGLSNARCRAERWEQSGVRSECGGSSASAGRWGRDPSREDSVQRASPTSKLFLRFGWEERTRRRNSFVERMLLPSSSDGMLSPRFTLVTAQIDSLEVLGTSLMDRVNVFWGVEWKRSFVDLWLGGSWSAVFRWWTKSCVEFLRYKIQDCQIESYFVIHSNANSTKFAYFRYDVILKETWTCNV